MSWSCVSDLISLPVVYLLEDATLMTCRRFLEAQYAGPDGGVLYGLGVCHLLRRAHSGLYWSHGRKSVGKIQRSGLFMDAYVGQSGFESAFEEYLHGTDGVKLTTVDTEGNMISEYFQTEPKAAPMRRRHRYQHADGGGRRSGPGD